MNIKSGPNNKVYAAQQLVNERRYPEAIGALREHLKTHKNDAMAMGMLGVLHADIGKPAEGRRILKKALRLAPNSADLHCRYGRLLAKEFLFDQAIEEFRAAKRLNPNHTWSVRCQANALIAIHRHAEAYALVEKELEEHPDAPDLLIAHMLAAKPAGRPEEGLLAADRVLELPDLPDMLRNQTLYTRADFLDKLGRHEEAFRAYELANQEAPRQYDADHNREQTDELIRIWTRERIAELPVSERRSDQLVFIVGMPRSGTSLVEQIISSHPKAFGAGELPTIQRIVSTMRDNDPSPIAFMTDLMPLTKINIENAAKHYIDKVRELAPGAERITDKMPDNFRALGLISRLFPQAKIIHCRRDPRDNCMSCYTLFFVGKENGFAYDLEELGSFYADYWRLMEHWKSVLDIPILEVSYEDMVDDPEAQTRRLIEFVGLDWDDRCLEFHRTKRLVKTHSANQVNKPIYKSSVARWKRYKKWIQPLLRELPDEAIPDEVPAQDSPGNR